MTSNTVIPASNAEKNRNNQASHGAILVVATSLFAAGLFLFFQHTPTSLRWPLRLAWLVTLVWLVMTAVRALLSLRFTKRKLAFTLVLSGFCYVALTLICHVFIKLMSQRDDRLTTRWISTLPDECRRGIEAVIGNHHLIKFSPEIGWIYRPGHSAGGYTMNAQGIRGLREYPLQPPDSEKRILCMGDSFTFGVAVKDDEAYPAQAEKLRPGTEWINFGIPGTCLVQSYKHYMLKAREFGGRHVIIGFMTNDAQRTVNVFRPFVNADSGCPLTKPFAKWDNGRFTIEPNPYASLGDLRRLLADDRNELKKLAALDYLTWSRLADGNHGPVSRTFAYVWDVLHVDHSTDVLFDHRLPVARLVNNFISPDPYGKSIWEPSSPGFKAICAMFDQYHKQVVKDGRVPLIVIIPGPMDVGDYRKQYPRQYLPLLDHFEKKGYRYFDFLDPLVGQHKADLSEDTIFVNSHYQPAVNEELAREIIQALKLP